jgi:hypothetical protein
VALLLIIEFVIPEFKKKQKPTDSITEKKEELLL